MEQHKIYGPYERHFKRPLDFVCGIVTVVLFCWLYAIIAILVKIKLGSPIIFTQDRPGKNEKVFRLYKFRTMTDEKDENGVLLPDNARITKFGKFLRSTSIDELPEIFNIIKGDMSVIGPRPLLVEYLPYYTTEERQRHNVRPGLTGLAQVSGRNLLSWDERFKLDCIYVERITFLGDIRIIIDTVKKVLCRSDITVDGNYTMKNFDEERKEVWKS
ncbi:MAG: sugar transferase [Lachnospiraceae bacterium]|nr:sugar transferase [Lachnospiraceae bacterium]